MFSADFYARYQRGEMGGYGRRLPVTLKRMDATLQVLYDTHNALQMYVL
jgi:hypothetical protein